MEQQDFVHPVVDELRIDSPSTSSPRERQRPPITHQNFVHPVVDELRNTSLAVSSPLRRRSSVAVRTGPLTIVENDDEIERAVVRQQTTPVSSISDKIAEMTPEQREEAVAECIRMNTQNKINIKNAFSCNIIDFMSYMVRKKGSTNLQTASASLDVSAKIYALRVDGLYGDVLQMIGHLSTAEEGSQQDQNEGNRDTSTSRENEAVQKLKKKKKKRSSKILTTIKDLQGESDRVILEQSMFGDSDCQTSDMLYQAMVPQHYNCGHAINLYNDVILDVSEPRNEQEDDHMIPWPPIHLDPEVSEIDTMFKGFQFLNWSPEDEEDDQSMQIDLPGAAGSSLMADDNLVFDLDASLPHDEMDFAENEDIEMEVDGENEQVVERCRPANNRGENIFDINVSNIQDIARAAGPAPLEYSFPMNSLNIEWKGPSYWKVKFSRKAHEGVEGVSRQALIRRRRNNRELIYDDQLQEDCENKFLQRKTARMRAEYVRYNWCSDKITYPVEPDPYDPVRLQSFFLRTEDVEYPKERVIPNAADIINDMDDYDYGNENDQSFLGGIPEGDEGVHENLHNVSEPADKIRPSVFGTQFGVDASTQATQAFVGENLVEMPKLTQKIFISYSQRAKKIDMRKLKKCIWKKLTLSSIFEVNEVSAENEDVTMTKEGFSDVIPGSRKQPKSFAEIYPQLPNMLSKSNAEALSFQTAFVSLLHLANEKNLIISSSENFGDVFIEMEGEQ